MRFNLSKQLLLRTFLAIVFISVSFSIVGVYAAGVSFNDTDNKPLSSASPSFSGTATFSGNVGIGTTTPQGAFVVTSGRVGIGTWAPAYPLDVNGHISATNVYGSTASFYYYVDRDDTSYFINPSGTNPAGPSAVLGGNVGIGTTIPGGALTVMSGNVGIGTWKPESSLIVQGGNVGIGTLSAPSALYVAGTAEVQAFKMPLNPSAGYVLMSDSVGVGTWMAASTLATSSLWAVQNTVDQSIAGGNVGIGTTATTTAALTVMNGNVGIGTWKPATSLTVAVTGVAPEGLALTSTGVSHGRSTAPTNAFGMLAVSNFSNGGLALAGYSDSGSQPGAAINGVIGSASPTVGVGALTLGGQKYGGGSSLAALAATETVMTFQNNSTVMGAFLGSGNLGIGTGTPGGALTVMNGNVGIGTWKPAAQLHSIGETEQLRLGYNATNYSSFTTSSTGSLNVSSGGTNSDVTLNATGTGFIYLRGGSAGTTTDVVQVRSGNANTASAIQFGKSSDGSLQGSFGALNSSNEVFFFAAPAYPLTFYTNATKVGTWTTGGNLGIGTTIPGGALTVMNGNVGIGTWKPNTLLTVKGGDVLLYSGSNVGIARATAPQTALHVGNGAANPPAQLYLADYTNLTASGYPQMVAQANQNWLYWGIGAHNGASTSALRIGSTSGFAQTWPAAETTGFQLVTLGNMGIGTFATSSRLTVMGNVGIGTTGGPYMTTTAPTNGLIVEGNVGIGTFSPFGGSLIVGTGNVGIGSLTPGTALDVNGVVRSISGGFTFPDGTTQTTAASGGSSQWLTVPSVGIGTYDAVGIGTVDATGAMLAVIGGNVGIGTTMPQGALTVMGGNVGVGTWKPGGLIQIGATQSAAFLVEAGGNVGIGTFTPKAKLAIMGGNVGIGTARPSSNLDIQNFVYGVGSGMRFGADAAAGGTVGNIAFYQNSNNYNVGNIRLVRSPLTGEGGDLLFETLLAFAGSPSERMRISNTGNVGIGTTIPSGGLIVMRNNVGIGTWKPDGLLQVKGGELLVPVGAGQTPATAGSITIDTTDDQIKYYGSAARTIPYVQEKCFTLENPATSDDNIPFFLPGDAITIASQYCMAIGGTSVTMHVSDGTNDMEDIVCATTPGQADDGSLTNNTFSANELMEFDTVAVSGTVNYVIFCNRYTVDAQ